MVRDLDRIEATQNGLETENRVLTVLTDLPTTRPLDDVELYAPTVPVFLAETIWFPGNRDRVFVQDF